MSLGTKLQVCRPFVSPSNSTETSGILVAGDKLIFSYGGNSILLYHNSGIQEDIFVDFEVINKYHAIDPNSKISYKNGSLSIRGEGFSSKLKVMDKPMVIDDKFLFSVRDENVVSVNTKEFFAAMKKISPLIESKSVSVALTCALISFGGGKMKVAGGTVNHFCEFSFDIGQEYSGKLLISKYCFDNLISFLQYVISEGVEEIKISGSGKILFDGGSAGKICIQSLDSTQFLDYEGRAFPDLDRGDPFTIDKLKFLKGYQLSQVGVSEGFKGKIVLQGEMGDIKIISFDDKIESDISIGDCEHDFMIQIDGSYLIDLLNIEKEVELRIGGGRLFHESEGVRFIIAGILKQ